MKIIRIDGKEYEFGSEAHLDAVERKHASDLKAATDLADAAEKERNELKTKLDAATTDLATEKARADKAEAEAKKVPALVARAVRVQTLAVKAKLTKVDGKDVADADEGTVLLAIAKKALPDLDVAKLNLSPEQLLELIAQKVGAATEAAPAGDPAATDEGEEMPGEEEEEEEQPMDSRGDSIFAARARAEGKPGAKPKDRGRSYEDVRADRDDRVFNAWKPKKAS